MKNIAFALIAALFAPSAFSSSVIETGDLKEYYVDFDGADAVTLIVSSETYTAARPRTVINIRKVDSKLYVVSQENLYYTMEVVYPPLPLVERRDVASELIQKDSLVRLLVPANLTVKVEDFHPGFTCMAYWTGFELNEVTGQCEQIGTSGCSNPFPNKTLESCEIANGLR